MMSHYDFKYNKKTLQAFLDICGATHPDDHWLTDYKIDEDGHVEFKSNQSYYGFNMFLTGLYYAEKWKDLYVEYVDGFNGGLVND